MRELEYNLQLFWQFQQEIAAEVSAFVQGCLLLLLLLLLLFLCVCVCVCVFIQPKEARERISVDGHDSYEIPNHRLYSQRVAVIQRL